VTNVAGDPIVLGWTALQSLTTRLAEDARLERIPDVVIGVLRNGMIPAVMVCHQLGLRDLRGLHVTHTIADGVDSAKTVRPLVQNIASLGDLTGRHVLVVDDISGSGETLSDVVALVLAAGPITVRTAVCLVNRANWRNPTHPRLELTYVGSLVDRWVIFPWENR
jgi:hypoxanthine phosphoribosyltransferase